MQQLYTYTCRIHIDAMNKDERHSLLEKYVPLTLLKGFKKGYSRFYCERDLETEENCNILTLTLMAISVLSFLFSRAAQPEVWGPSLLDAGFIYRILSPTGLVSKTHSGVPKAPSAGWWLSLPHLVSNSSDLQLTSCLHRVI